MPGSNIDFEKNGRDLTFHLHGRLDRTTVNALWPDSKLRISEAGVRNVTVDLQGITRLDSSGVAYLRCVETFCEKGGIGYEERKIPDVSGRIKTGQGWSV